VLLLMARAQRAVVANPQSIATRAKAASKLQVAAGAAAILVDAVFMRLTANLPAS
jgi:hypothetical protein